MDEVGLREWLKGVEDGAENNLLSNIKCNLKEWSKESLLNLLTHMETEMTSLEIAFKIVKSSKLNGEKDTKYNGITALKNDDSYYTEHKNMKNDFIYLKIKLEDFSTSRNKYYDKMKSIVDQLSHQYQNSCDEWAKGAQKWLDFKQQLDQLKEQCHNEKQQLAEQLGEVIEEKEILIGRVDCLEKEARMLRLHREGAMVLANERSWFSNKISALISMVTNLESDLEVMKHRNSSLQKQLIQFEKVKKSRTYDEKEKGNLHCEFEMRMKAKDDEIIRLRQEVNKLKFNQTLNPLTHINSPHSFYNTSQPVTPRRNPEVSLNSTTLFKPSLSQNLLNSSPLDQSTIKRSPLKPQSNASYPNHRPFPDSQGKIKIENLHDTTQNISCNQNSSDLNLESPNSKSSTPVCLPSYSSTPSALNNQKLQTTSTSVEFLNHEEQKEDGSPKQTTRFNIFGSEMADLQELISSVISKHPSDHSKLRDSSLSVDTSAASSLRSSPSISPTSSTSTVIEGDLKVRNSAFIDLLVLQQHITNSDESGLGQLLSRSFGEVLDDECKLPNGIHPLHFSVECNAHVCLEVLLDHGCSTKAIDTDQMTPLHLAAAEGNITCLALLLRHGSSVHQANHIGMTPLHSAASNGHVDCCLLLLAAGAAVDAVNINNWTPLHTAIFSDHHQCLREILNFSFNHPSKDSFYHSSIRSVISMVDKEGCTLVHLAIVKDTKDFLEALMAFSGGRLEVEKKDRWNRSPLQIASPACLNLLRNDESSRETSCHVMISLQRTNNNTNSNDSTTNSPTPPTKHNSNNTLTNGKDIPLTTPSTSTSLNLQQQMHAGSNSIIIGSVSVLKTTDWPQLEEQLSTSFLNHVSQVSVGISTAKISKLEHELSLPPPSSLLTTHANATSNPFTLGLGIKSVKYYSIGRYHWFPGTVTEKTPLEMLSTYETTSFSVKLFGTDDMRLDSLAYDSLIPVFILQNYLRIIQQYKSVVFYGPRGTGKSYLVEKLAIYLQMQESCSGGKSKVSLNHFDESCSSEHLLTLLIQKECLIPSKQPLPAHHSCILVLDGISSSQLQTIFTDIASSLENRGPSHLINLKHENNTGTFYLHPNCYIICTMDTNRSIGLDFSIQQRFKWVHMRSDQEPCRYLLHRHLSRKLAHQYTGIMPSQENPVYKAIEWLIMVWQRLNEGIGKLGLVDVIFGPCCILECPIRKNKPKDILRWLVIFWNRSVVPTISQAIFKSSRSLMSAKGVMEDDRKPKEMKVVGTALYVLMQRAIVSGCPLSGPERDRYMSCFKGCSGLESRTGDQILPTDKINHHLKHPLPSDKLSIDKSNQKKTTHLSNAPSSTINKSKAGRLSPYLEKRQKNSLIIAPLSSSSSLRSVGMESPTTNSASRNQFSSVTSLPTSQPFQSITQPSLQPINQPINKRFNNQPNRKPINQPNSQSINPTINQSKTSTDWLGRIGLFAPQYNNDNNDSFCNSSDDSVIVNQPTK